MQDHAQLISSINIAILNPIGLKTECNMVERVVLQMKLKIRPLQYIL